MAYASILCETCERKESSLCYCSPNSVCDKYKEKTESSEESKNE